MLSHRDLDARITSGNIKLWYSFLPHPTSGVAYEPDRPVDLTDETSPATLFYRQHAYSAHLHLTVGPLVKSLSRHPIAGRQSYRHHKGCFDLRRQDNAIVMEPNELLLVATNERLALDGRTAAIVTPRVTNTDSGLWLNTAYIDPFYDGIMRVVVGNLTPERQTLRLLEPIAQCFFFDLPGGVDESFRAGFPHKSVFFGQNWQRLLESEADPFPRLKVPLARSRSDEMIAGALSHLRSLSFVQTVFAGTAVLSIGTLLFTVGRLQSMIENNKTLIADVDSVKQSLSSLRDSVPLVGSSVITIRAGEREGRAQFDVAVPSARPVHVWMSPDRTSSSASPEIEIISATTPGGTQADTRVALIVRLRREPLNTDAQIPVLWMITK